MSVLPPTQLKHDKTTGRAFIRWHGKKTYFGKWGTVESTKKFAAWLSAAITPAPIPPSEIVPSLNSCAAAYLLFAEEYYSKDNEPTQEFLNMKAAVAALITHIDDKKIPITDFGPKRLAAIRDRMALTRDKPRLRYARSTINATINRIRRFVRWCVSQELLSSELAAALESVGPLTKGRTQARESLRVKPVPLSSVTITLRFVSPTVAAMATVQLLCGMRPQDVCRMTMREIDRTGDIWIYTPVDHKTAHLGRDLIKAIPVAAQEVLIPYFQENLDEPLFSPADSLEFWHNKSRNPNRLPKKSRKSRERRPYSTGSYGQAIECGIKRAAKERPPIEIPHWTPNQLRHSIATILREEYGIEAAQLYLGHSDVDTTLIYAEKSRKRLSEIARALVSPLAHPRLEHVK